MRGELQRLAGDGQPFVYMLPMIRWRWAMTTATKICLINNNRVLQQYSTPSFAKLRLRNFRGRFRRQSFHQLHGRRAAREIGWFR